MKNMRQKPTLSIIVIGRNEADNLQRLFNSLTPLAKSEGVEIIYVDSASTDSSIDIAKVFVSKVVRLGQSKNLSASAGRHVGTLVARGRWILYLDGDMELTPEFCEKTRSLTTSKRTISSICGYIGRYDDHYIDGSIRRNLLRQDPRKEKARYIGGAVLLLRDTVLAAGNWNHRVFSYEELDLYTRLLSQGYYVEYIDLPMIVHHTQKQPRFKTFLSLFIPVAGMGKKYFGIGQVIRSRISKGSLFSFVRFFPYPFVYLGLLLLGIIWSCTVPSLRVLSILFFLVALTYVIFTRGVISAVVYLSFVPQICLGFFNYPRSWKPYYEEM